MTRRNSPFTAAACRKCSTTPWSSSSDPRRCQTGARLTGFMQDEGGVTAQFVNSVDGGNSHTVRGDVLICADGIHSVGRRTFYPDEGPPSWNGVIMWRGATDWPIWEDGETMAIGRRHGRQVRALSDCAARKTASS